MENFSVLIPLVINCCLIPSEVAITYIHTYNTYISSIHDIPLGAFGYETLSDKRYLKCGVHIYVSY